MSSEPNPLESTQSTLSETDLFPQDNRLHLSCFGRTDVGQVRSHNEDQFLIASLKLSLDVLGTSLDLPPAPSGTERGHLLIVADGVGGNVAGQHASALAVRTVTERVTTTIPALGDDGQPPPSADIFRELREAVCQADIRIFEKVEERIELHGMGTTMTLAYVRDARLFLAHVGDSRCYLLRGKQLKLLTRDHTMADEMARQGQIKPEDVEGHPLNNVITNVVGGSEIGVSPEVQTLDLLPADKLFLCSDGLTKMIKDDEIQTMLGSDESPKQLCDTFIRVANERGGKDNVTVLVASLEEISEATT